MKNFFRLLPVVFFLLVSCNLGSPQPEPTPPSQDGIPPSLLGDPFLFGLVLRGAFNDQGNSQLHYDAGLYVQDFLPNVAMLYVDRVNESDRPGISAEQLAEDLAAKGAKLVIFTDPGMEEAALAFAQNHPEIKVVQIGGVAAWKDGRDYRGPQNLGNLYGRLEYAKMISGCAAALTTQNGQIGYLAPQVDDLSRRMAASAYLGARYCWTKTLGRDAAGLRFTVSGAISEIFYNSGFDVVISGSDTAAPAQGAARFAAAGRAAWVVTDNQMVSCAENQASCLGNAYFNWGPAYLSLVTAAQDGLWVSTWDWKAPDWSDINSPDTSSIGFLKGPALSEQAAASLDAFIAELAGGLTLWKGPLTLWNGTPYLQEGEVAVDAQIWYLPDLLQGMEMISP